MKKGSSSPSDTCLVVEGVSEAGEASSRAPDDVGEVEGVVESSGGCNLAKVGLDDHEDDEKDHSWGGEKKGA